MGYVLVLSDKIAKKLMSKFLNAYPVHVLLMNCSAKYYRCAIEQGHSVVTFLAVKITTNFLELCYTVQD